MREVLNKIVKLLKALKTVYAIILICGGVVGCVAIVFSLVGILYLKRASLAQETWRFLLSTVGLAIETWQFWVPVVAALLWIYLYRENRRRQEVIIELLYEIKRRLR